MTNGAFAFAGHPDRAETVSDELALALPTRRVGRALFIYFTDA
jgi:hypothetical protein